MGTIKEGYEVSIKANQRDFKDAFQKHYHTFLNWGATGSIISKRLILVYCVECGLKWKLMERLKIQRVEDAQEDVEKELCSHNLTKLLKRLNMAYWSSFPQIQTVYNDSITIETYHQLCRYSISPHRKDENKIQSYDQKLAEIAEWLSGRV